MVEGDVVAGGQLVKIAVVADDGADVHRQQAGLGAEHQIIQAVAVAADHDDGAHGRFGRMQLPVHVEGHGKGGQTGLEFFKRKLVAGKLHTHEKQACVGVVVLRSFFNVAAVVQQEA